MQPIQRLRGGGNMLPIVSVAGGYSVAIRLPEALFARKGSYLNDCFYYIIWCRFVTRTRDPIITNGAWAVPVKSRKVI